MDTDEHRLEIQKTGLLRIHCLSVRTPRPVRVHLCSSVVD